MKRESSASYKLSFSVSLQILESYEGRGLTRPTSNRQRREESVESVIRVRPTFRALMKYIESWLTGLGLEGIIPKLEANGITTPKKWAALSLKDMYEVGKFDLCSDTRSSHGH